MEQIGDIIIEKEPEIKKCLMCQRESTGDVCSVECLEAWKKKHLPKEKRTFKPLPVREEIKEEVKPKQKKSRKLWWLIPLVALIILIIILVNTMVIADRQGTNVTINQGNTINNNTFEHTFVDDRVETIQNNHTIVNEIHIDCDENCVNEIVDEIEERWNSS